MGRAFLLGAVIPALFLPIFTTHAFAQGAPRNLPRAPCMEHGKVVEMLASKYQEQAAAMGVIGEGKAIMEIYTSEEGTWTVMVSGPDGVSCLVASGDQWTGLKEPAL